MNIVEPILFQAKHNAPAPAMCAPGMALGLISYGRLAQFITNISSRALSLALSPDAIVAVHVREPILHSAIVLAFANIGLATVSLREPAFPAGLRVHALVTDAQNVAPLGSTKIISVGMDWTQGDEKPLAPHHLYRGAGDVLCRISLTSGSTGEPKAIGFTHRMQADRLARYTHAYGGNFPDCARIFSDLGLPSSVGFRHLLHVLSRGGTFFFPGASPMDTLQTFELHRVQGLIASPGGLSGFLRFYEENPAFHCSFQTIIATGSPLSKQLSERVRARLCSQLVYYYGTTETGTVSSAPAHALAAVPGAVGYVTPGVTVEIVDDGDCALPVESEGALRIRSPMNVDRYLDDPALSKIVFRDGCFYTGDTGYLMKDGMLVVTGREKDVLNLGGDKIKPQTIEGVLTAFEGVSEAAAFALPNALGVDEVWALIVPNGRIDEAALLAHCRARLPGLAGLIPVRFVAVERLPRNENGKIERHRLVGLVPKNRA
jgi:acyl-coenzyme A synthetase/AMP-(fatty) acid ligase